MIIVFAIIIYIVLCSYIYMQKVNFSKKLTLLQPMVESVENIRDVLYYCETHPEFKYQYLSPTIDDLLGPGKLEVHLRNPSAIYDLVHPDDYALLEAKKMVKLILHNHFVFVSVIIMENTFGLRSMRHRFTRMVGMLQFKDYFVISMRKSFWKKN